MSEQVRALAHLRAHPAISDPQGALENELRKNLEVWIGHPGGMPQGFVDVIRYRREASQRCQVRAQIGRVAQALQHVRVATAPAEKTLERTVERLGTAAVNTATSLLPKGLQLPIRVAVQALERAVDLARGLGLGR